MDGRRTDTRERILDAALDLMGERGYGAVTVRDVSDEVGIKAASLYKHFKGKREVFDALIAREIAYIEDTLHEAGASATLDDDPAPYATGDAGELAGLVWESYAPFFSDVRIRKLRHLLETSRHGDGRCRRLYDAIFIERPLALQERIFGSLVESGVFNPCDTRLAAMQFHGPMLMMIGMEPSAGEARGFCSKHLEAFNAAHRRRRP